MHAWLLPKAKEKATKNIPLFFCKHACRDLAKPCPGCTACPGHAARPARREAQGKRKRRRGVLRVFGFLFFLMQPSQRVFDPLPLTGGILSGCSKLEGLFRFLAACACGCPQNWAVCAHPGHSLSPAAANKAPVRHESAVSPGQRQPHDGAGDAGTAEPGGTEGRAQSPLVPAESVPL